MSIIHTCWDFEINNEEGVRVKKHKKSNRTPNFDLIL